MRKHSLTEIQYVLIAPKGKIFSPIVPPEEFDNGVISFIKKCPKDILQLKEGINYYELTWRYAFNNPIDFRIIYDEDFVSTPTDFFSYKQLRLFFITEKSKNFDEIIKYLKSIHSVSHFYLIRSNENKPSDHYGLKNTIHSPSEFITKIIFNQEIILKHLNFEEINLVPELPIEYKSLIHFDYFIPTHNNYHMINSLIGNFGNSSSDKTEADEIKIAADEGKNASENSHAFTRQNLIVNQIDKLDFFPTVALKEGLFELESGIHAFYAPLILIAPFHNPDIKELYSISGNNLINDTINEMQAEQTENYVTLTKPKTPESLLSGITINKKYIQFLDDVSYLHASNSFSPIIRLPQKGKSIYRSLSFFGTNSFTHLTNIKNRKKLRKTIIAFDKEYRTVSISPKLEQKIKERNSQIILISDLPLEWLHFDNVPLIFTHDICRLPASSPRALMANYALNNHFEYTIPQDILKKTLVIFGSDDLVFREWQDQCTLLSREHGFNTCRCSTISCVVKAIKKYTPDFLVFDCHGSYDKKLKSTFLNIGEEKLTNDIIIKENLTASIIFISACGTAPTYGTINTIANSFFQNGCHSVTTTYLPIEVSTSSVLYLRLLNKLKIAAEDGIHKNWLEFVSHVIRTSSIMEAFKLAYINCTAEEIKGLQEANVIALTDSLLFQKRRDLFLSLDKIIKEKIEMQKDTFSSIIPEYLFYSNLGRSDLINFKSWLTKFREKNKANYSLE